MPNNPLQQANQNWGQAAILNAQGNPMHPTGVAPGTTNPNYAGGGTGGHGGGVDPMSEIAGLKTQMTWIERGLGTLAVLGLAAFGWIFYNIYQPMETLSKDSAVQTTILAGIKDDVREIRDRFNQHDDQSERGPQSGQAEPVRKGP